MQPTCPLGQYLRSISATGVPTCVAIPEYATVFASCAGTCMITVPGTYAMGSSSGTITVSRTSVGNYTVTVPWINTGVPQVTAYGTSTNCRVNGWNSIPVVVNVHCTTHSGTASDSNFNVTVNGN